jgi:hypothetical protein
MAKSQNKPAYNPFKELAEIRDQKHEHPVTQTPEHSGSQALRHSGAKSQNPDFVKLTAYVPKELHRAAKARLVEHGREISDLIEELVADWLKRQPPRSP